MLYYTQVIFIRKGSEAVFHEFEDQVLPLLERHNGKLLYRVRPDPQNVIETSIDYPYEIHLVSFDSKSSFMAYAGDEDRKRHLKLKEDAVSSVLLIEGVAL